jgi:hypothetical protein
VIRDLPDVGRWPETRHHGGADGDDVRCRPRDDGPQGRLREAGIRSGRGFNGRLHGQDRWLRGITSRRLRHCRRRRTPSRHSLRRLTQGTAAWHGHPARRWAASPAKDATPPGARWDRRRTASAAVIGGYQQLGIVPLVGAREPLQERDKTAACFQSGERFAGGGQDGLVGASYQDGRSR